MEKHNLLVANSLCCVQDGQIQARVLNPSPLPVVIHQYERIGLLQHLDQACVIDSLPENSASKESLQAHREVAEALQWLEAGIEGLSGEERAQLHSLLEEFKDIFAVRPGDIGRTSIVRHKIDTGNSAPVKLPPRRLPLQQHEEVRQLIEDMSSKGVIEPADGPWASPIVLVRKKDGTTRFCVDFRRVNGLTKKDAHPLPRIDDTLDRLSMSELFSTLEVGTGKSRWSQQTVRKLPLPHPSGCTNFG